MALTFTATPFLNRGDWTQESSTSRVHTRIVRVTGFVASTYYPMIVELYADPGLPVIGSKVPDPDSEFALLRLRRWRIAEVVCRPGAAELHIEEEFGSFSITGSTVPDADGPVVFNQRSVSQDFETTFDRNGALVQTIRNNETQTKTIVRPRSYMVYELERYEDENPEPRARPLIDTVNASTWNGRAARTVFFAEFFATTRDDGDTYQTFYIFWYDPDTWDRDIPHKLPSGLPPPDLPTSPSPGTALIRPEVIPQSNFSSLNISIPS